MVLINSNILKKFFNESDIVDIIEYGNGHINNTYLVSTTSQKFIMQQVNNRVFNIDNLVQNYNYLIKVASKYGLPGKLFPRFITNSSGTIHIIDSNGTAWRLNEFIENSSSYAISPDTLITEKAGRAMGKFQLFLSNLNDDKFKDTIPEFHNPLRRLNEFEDTLVNSDTILQEKAATEITLALENKDIALRMSELLKNNQLPKRITHNDTKLENILFDNTNDHTYVIDLDTVMKGSILFDFGDMIRSITSTAKEDEKDLAKVIFRPDHFEALCRGYLGELKTIITPTEKDNLLSGALCIVYIQGLRFLTDYLSGNPYYKVDYPNHNLIRCRTQFKLLQELLLNTTFAKATIKSALN